MMALEVVYMAIKELTNFGTIRSSRVLRWGVHKLLRESLKAFTGVAGRLSALEYRRVTPDPSTFDFALSPVATASVAWRCRRIFS